MKFHNIIIISIIGILTLLSVPCYAQSGSVYTSLQPKDCETMDSPFYQAKCPAKAGYDLQVYAGDLRSGIELIYNNKKIDYVPDNNLPYELGKVAEWRYKKINNKRKYYALIYRLSVAQLNPKGDGFLAQSKDKQRLIVIRLDKEKSCLLGIIKQSKNMNQKARNLADNESATCID